LTSRAFPPRPFRDSPGAAAFVLGLALGGFFDGILLHQILQWHHFLSLVEGEPLREIRNQILADGAFHVAAFLVALSGLIMLWRCRDRLGEDGAGRTLIVGSLLGFGVWQIADVVIFHWILRIHRIRVDVPDPLVWDIGWLVVFGLPPLLVAWWIARRRGSGPGRGRSVAVGLGIVVGLAGPWAAMPMPGADRTVVVFPEGIGSSKALSAVAAADGRTIWSSPGGDIVVLASHASLRVLDLYRNGALLVSTTPVLAGCAAWSRT
jgi:uncharacterized membrane protein